MIRSSMLRCPASPLGRLTAVLVAIVLLASATMAHGTALIWQERPLPNPDVRFLQVASSGTTLLARAHDPDDPFGPGLLFTSDDGLDWAPIDPGLAGRSIDAIGFALERFIVVLDDGQLLLSADNAASWSAVPGPENQRLVVRALLEYDGRVWLLARWRRVNSIGIDAVGLLSSGDFSEWSLAYRTEFPSPVFVASPSGLAAGGNAFASTVTAPPPTVPTLTQFALSSDGDDWLDLAPGRPNAHSQGVVWNGSAFLALAAPPSDGGAAPLRLARRTPDGSFDIVEVPAQVGSFRTLRGGPDGLILQRSASPFNRLLTSPGGNDWTEQPTVPTGTFRDFARWKSGWVGVGTTTIRGVPQQALAVPTLPLGGLTVLAIVLALAGAIAAARQVSPRRPTSPSGSSAPGG